MNTVRRVARLLRQPSAVIARRIGHETCRYAERWRGPRRERRLDENNLLRAISAGSLESAWSRAGAQAFPGLTTPVAKAEYDRVCDGDSERILRRAENACRHVIDLLGSGPVNLGPGIDWHTDFKTGLSWQVRWHASIDYNNLERPSDVKVPWELSRGQWLIPAGQAYLLTGDERYALCVREVLESWIDSNPYGSGVNWACTMEPAMRVVTWSWLFHALHRSRSWQNAGFRQLFLRAMYLHGDFISRNLEVSSVNGNHLTADAVGLVFAGLFFGGGSDPEKWARTGWEILCRELPLQVFPDGVDYEGSLAYHRLVCELFILAAALRQARGLPVPEHYRDRVVAMARFTAAYTRPDGLSPLVGDADDARGLPFGGQSINDHRHICAAAGLVWHVPDLTRFAAEVKVESFWACGPESLACLPQDRLPAASHEFPHGGFYVMRNARDHVFIDCGPVGLAGRGGHGHNDCLSFEAALDGVPLITDCGSYVYTASPAKRQRFRSTSCHNTPFIDGEEINRFWGPADLWSLRYDALYEVLGWRTAAGYDEFIGQHAAYRRLPDPVTVVRTLRLNHATHELTIVDRFLGRSSHSVQVPLHLAPGIDVCVLPFGGLQLNSQNRVFHVHWSSEGDWDLKIEPARVSQAYGCVVATSRLVWERSGALAPLEIRVRLASEGERSTFVREALAGTECSS